MNKILTVAIIVVIIVGGFFYFRPQKGSDSSISRTSTNNSTPTPTPEPVTDTTPTMTPPTEEEIKAVPAQAVATIETNLGSFQVTLNGKAAPKTVANFIKLSKAGFYDNLTFHRIVKVPTFHLIQGGDPAGNGTGGPGYIIPAEIGLKHTKGAIATARTGDEINPNRDSSGSQFYIVEENIPQLDGQYTVFGHVTSGMDVVEKIGAVETNASDMPLTPVIIKKISIK